MKKNTFRLAIALLALSFGETLYGQDVTVDILPPETVISPVSESLVNEARSAVDRGIKWLIANQGENGNWSNPEFPALTALPLWAMAQSSYSGDEAADRACAYIMTTRNDDGSFCVTPSEERKGGGLCNYNTALCMTALHATGRPEFIGTVQNARQYIVRTQHFGNDIYRGGMGYDPDTGRAYADLSNSYIAFEAMRLTESVEDLRSEVGEGADLDWDAAAEFISRVQNRPESNDQTWASDDPAEQGGFAYKPDSSQAGSYTNAEGEIRLRSYGSMTYAGMLSFIYADVDKNDPRVQSAFEWSQKHWNLDENPGMGSEGLFYYYQTLSKALAAMGVDVLDTENGNVNWKTELIKKLVSLQKIEPDGTGYWINEEGRWWEADPVLVTSYSLLALQIALKN